MSEVGSAVKWVSGCVAAVLVVLSLALACQSLSTPQFNTDDDYGRYVRGLGISGVTAQAATARLEREGYACRTVGNVIQGVPNELVVLCSRRANDGSCHQDQSVVLRLDWVGEPRPEMAPGMRIRDVGPALGKRDCS